MNKEMELILETLSAQIQFERDGILQDLWNKKLEIDDALVESGE